MAKRRCKAKTKRGTRCRAAPLKGKQHCAAHDPVSPGSTRFGSPEQARGAGQLGGRPRKPRPDEILRGRIEADIDRWLAPLEAALTQGKPIQMWDGDERKHHIEHVIDPALGMKAMKLAFERVYGKPRQAIELSGEDGAAIQLEADLSDPKIKEALFDVARAIDARRSGD